MRNLVNQSKSSVLNSPEQAQTQALFVYAKLQKKENKNTSAREN